MDAAALQTLVDQLYEVLPLFRGYREAKRFHNRDRASYLLGELRKVAGPVISRKTCMLVLETLVNEGEGDESGEPAPGGNGLMGWYLEGMTKFLVDVRLPDKKAQELVDFCREAAADSESDGFDMAELQSSLTHLLANAQEGLARFTRDELDEETFSKLLWATFCIGAGAVLLSVSVHTFVQLELSAESKSMFAGVGGTLVGLGATMLIRQVDKAQRDGKEHEQVREEAKEFLRPFLPPPPQSQYTGPKEGVLGSLPRARPTPTPDKKGPEKEPPGPRYSI
jgi:hypothetical protein